MLGIKVSQGREAIYNSVGATKRMEREEMMIPTEL